MMSFTDVFLLLSVMLVGLVSLFLHYVQYTKFKQLEKKVNQPMQIQVMDVTEYDEREIW